MNGIKEHFLAFIDSFLKWVIISFTIILTFIILDKVFSLIWTNIAIAQELIFISLEEEQEIYKERFGTYFSDTSDKDLQIHTYEAPCSGWYTEEKITDTQIRYDGYGDLSDNYTYVKNISVSTDTTTSTISR